MKADLMSVEQMAGSSAQALATCIGDEEDEFGFGENIHQIATELQNNGGTVPTAKDDLVALGVDETVARMMMQQVFGSTHLVIGLHTRKVLCALDMFDWEASGAVSKKDVKMAKITGDHVKRSLETWLPKVETRTFQYTMESIGEVIGKNPVGFWGKLKAIINKNFSAKDKKIVFDMVESILRFYKATKSGGRRKDF